MGQKITFDELKLYLKEGLVFVDFLSNELNDEKLIQDLYPKDVVSFLEQKLNSSQGPFNKKTNSALFLSLIPNIDKPVLINYVTKKLSKKFDAKSLLSVCWLARWMNSCMRSTDFKGIITNKGFDKKEEFEAYCELGWTTYFLNCSPTILDGVCSWILDKKYSSTTDLDFEEGYLLFRLLKK